MHKLIASVVVVALLAVAGCSKAEKGDKGDPGAAGSAGTGRRARGQGRSRSVRAGWPRWAGWRLRRHFPSHHRSTLA